LFNLTVNHSVEGLGVCLIKSICFLISCISCIIICHHRFLICYFSVEARVFWLQLNSQVHHVHSFSQHYFFPPTEPRK
jgi:hypothetical protein